MHAKAKGANSNISHENMHELVQHLDPQGSDGIISKRALCPNMSGPSHMLTEKEGGLPCEIQQPIQEHLFYPCMGRSACRGVITSCYMTCIAHSMR